MSLLAEIESLKGRVAALELSRRKTNRGRTNQRGAADYLGRSREWLRKLHLQGKGPRRGVDGSYSYDDLDALSSANTFPRKALIKMANQFPTLAMEDFHASDGEGGWFFLKGSIRAGAVDLVKDEEAERAWEEAMCSAMCSATEPTATEPTSEASASL